MLVNGRFIIGSPNVSVNLSSPLFTGGFVRFLIDTGASRTILQDADFRRLSIPSGLLTPAPSPMVGLGGTVGGASVLPGVDIEFSVSTGGLHTVHQDVWVMPALAAGISLPSVLGRDVINLSEFKCDFPHTIVHLDF